MILACFVLGLSTREVAAALLPVLGRPVSPATVSAVTKQLDAAIAAFHRRLLYRVLVLDGVELRRKTGAGAVSLSTRGRTQPRCGSGLRELVSLVAERRQDA